MLTPVKGIFAACASAVLLAAACSSTPDEAAANKPADPRQGAEVKNVCFTSQIRDWRENDRQSVIVTVGNRKEYKLSLIGGCDPGDAFTSIGLISRFGGGSCLTPGDELVTDTRFANGLCRIDRIYEWNKDAKAPEAASAN
ncbi:MAG: hypothetical protein EON93_07015 [Burkholderiales bacterium]|nr:MAG: hypothetical protein EON93_07015 [Burkholderiales bacterium]